MTDHLTREQLLQYTDGELSKSGMRTAGIHIQACWACRIELERLQEDIGVIVDAQDAVFWANLPGPPNPWPRLEPRLAAIKPRRFHWRSLKLSFTRMRVPVYVSCLVLACAAIGVVLWRAPTVSAKETLQRAADADARRMAITAESVVRQRVRVTKARNGSASKATGQVDSWRSTTGVYWKLEKSDEVAADLRSRYETRNLLDLPLSAVAYQSWSKEVRSEGAVSRSSHIMDVKFQANEDTESDLRWIIFHVHQDDWHVSAMELDFSDAQFQISEEELSILPKTDVPSDVLAHLDPPITRLDTPASVILPAASLSEMIAPPDPIAAHPVLNPGDAEMDVRFKLHQIGADLGEPVEVNRDGNRILVRAVGMATERQELLRQLFQDSAEVELVLQPVSMNSRPESEARLIPAPQSSDGENGQSKESRRLDQQRIANWFGSADSEEEFARYVLAKSTDLLSRLYALRELQERWPREARIGLSETSKARFNVILQDHVHAATQRCFELKLTLKPLVSSFASPNPSATPAPAALQQDSARYSLNAARHVDRLLRSLFTTSELRVPLNDALPEIQRQLVGIEEVLKPLASPNFLTIN